MKNNDQVQAFIYFIRLFFHCNFTNIIKCRTISSNFYFFYEAIFRRSDTHPTKVGDMDPRLSFKYSEFHKQL